jgi:hypothetical protein
MAELILTDKEKETLILVLESNLSDLSVEIADTDRMNFRNQLKARRDVMQKILDALKKIGP